LTTSTVVSHPRLPFWASA